MSKYFFIELSISIFGFLFSRSTPVTRMERVITSEPIPCKSRGGQVKRRRLVLESDDDEPNINSPNPPRINSPDHSELREDTELRDTLFAHETIQPQPLAQVSKKTTLPSHSSSSDTSDSDDSDNSIDLKPVPPTLFHTKPLEQALDQDTVPTAKINETDDEDQDIVMGSKSSQIKKKRVSFFDDLS